MGSERSVAHERDPAPAGDHRLDELVHRIVQHVGVFDVVRRDEGKERAL